MSLVMLHVNSMQVAKERKVDALMGDEMKKPLGQHDELPNIEHIKDIP